MFSLLLLSGKNVSGIAFQALDPAVIKYNNHANLLKTSCLILRSVLYSISSAIFWLSFMLVQRQVTEGSLKARFALLIINT